MQKVIYRLERRLRDFVILKYLLRYIIKPKERKMNITVCEIIL